MKSIRDWKLAQSWSLVDLQWSLLMVTYIKYWTEQSCIWPVRRRYSDWSEMYLIKCLKFGLISNIFIVELQHTSGVFDSSYASVNKGVGNWRKWDTFLWESFNHWALRMDLGQGWISRGSEGVSHHPEASGNV